MTLQPDHINAIFEISGSFFLFLNVLQLHHDKIVRGVHLAPIFFWTTWGLWNLYFYPSLDQWWSFYGGVGLVLVNIVWVSQMIYYKRLEKRDPGYADRVRRSELMKASKGEY